MLIPVDFPTNTCRITHGPNATYFPNLVGKPLASMRRCLAGVFSIPDESEPWVGGTVVGADYRLRAGDSVEFLVRRGWKGADDQPIREAGPLFTVKEAAAELHCSISFVYKLMQTGQLAFERRGRRKLPLAISVAAYRQRNTCPATSQSPRPIRSPRQPYQFQRLFRGKPAGPGK
jgi:excisionase family DNA binding protein